MIDKSALIDSIAAKVNDLVYGDKSQTREDAEKNIKALISSSLAKLDLVTRDEFDAQVAVLKYTRERLEALEKELAARRPEADEGSEEQQSPQ